MFEPMDAYGLISSEEGEFLRTLAAQVKGGCIVEIGAFLGRSTLFLSRGAPDRPIFTIDCFSAWDWLPREFKDYASPVRMQALLEKNLEAGGAANVLVIAGKAREVPLDFIPPDGIGLIFQDGEHYTEDVYCDVQRLLPYLRPDGIVVYHDLDRPGHEGVRPGMESLWPDWEKRRIGQVGHTLALSANSTTPTYHQINAICPGWSSPLHQKFFHWLLTEQAPEIQKVLVLGVYLGRDMAYLAKILKERGTPYRLDGVDLFREGPCADWTEEQRAGGTWEKAHGVPSPDRTKALENLERLGLSKHVYLYQEEGVRFLETSNDDPRWYWDLIYIDTSHDYETVTATIRAAVPRLRDGGYLAGDDCIDDSTWGVRSAVHDTLARYNLIRWDGMIVRSGKEPSGVINVNPLWLARKEEFVG